MKYRNRLDQIKIDRMRHLRKSLKKSEETAEKNSKDPTSVLNTRIQKSGMGYVQNSHALRVGAILNKNKEKVLDNIEKLHDPEKRKKETEKKIKKLSIIEFILDDNKLKVIYEDKKISFTSFIKEADKEARTIIKDFTKNKKDEGFNGSLYEFIKTKVKEKMIFENYKLKE